jgi:hypothetical protein
MRNFVGNFNKPVPYYVTHNPRYQATRRIARNPAAHNANATRLLFRSFVRVLQRLESYQTGNVTGNGAAVLTAMCGG